MPSCTAFISRFPNQWTEGIKVNAVARRQVGGREFHEKRRLRLAWPILQVANGFFRLACSPVRTSTALRSWQQWEVQCFLGLHGAEGFHASGEGPRSVLTETLPGRNLTLFLDAGQLTPAMAAAAGRELRRAHAWKAEGGGDASWSHGDPHAGNFLYDAATERARLIDFEVRHDPQATPAARQADDLLAFLQDLAGRITAERWLPCALAFLEGYGPEAVEPGLLRRLAPPGWGFSLLWYRVRTSFAPLAELRRRAQQLVSALVSVALPATPGRPLAPPLPPRGTPAHSAR